LPIGRHQAPTIEITAKTCAGTSCKCPTSWLCQGLGHGGRGLRDAAAPSWRGGMFPVVPGTMPSRGAGRGRVGAGRRKRLSDSGITRTRLLPHGCRGQVAGAGMSAAAMQYERVAGRGGAGGRAGRRLEDRERGACGGPRTLAAGPGDGRGIGQLEVPGSGPATPPGRPGVPSGPSWTRGSDAGPSRNAACRFFARSSSTHVGVLEDARIAVWRPGNGSSSQSPSFKRVAVEVEILGHQARHRDRRVGAQELLDSGAHQRRVAGPACAGRRGAGPGCHREAPMADQVVSIPAIISRIMVPRMCSPAQLAAADLRPDEERGGGRPWGERCDHRSGRPCTRRARRTSPPRSSSSAGHVDVLEHQPDEAPETVGVLLREPQET